MTQQPTHLEVADKIDQHLEGDSFQIVSRTESYRYQPWYAMLLSSMALLAAHDDVLYAHSDGDPAATNFRIVVFTASLVLVADVDLQLDGVPAINAVRRNSLVGIKLSASERIDSKERRSYGWPGMLNLALTYRDLKRPIEIVTDGANRYNVKEPSSIVTLIEGLSADLARNHPSVRPDAPPHDIWRI